MSALSRTMWASPEFRARKRASARIEQLRTPEAQAKRVAGIRAARAVWPDCPPDLASDYANLRRYFTAVDARAMLDPVFAAGRMA
ncbi:MULTISPECIES: hypothetical protein [unclassified Novosphingobium]|uniref:hypothetical protein n=1 Tax=unclassified Novosphingobium TaxID=2644732 RepID=UPI0010603CBB|nr:MULTISPECIES: hypothetical protein [unclassified Novosphingobium]